MSKVAIVELEGNVRESFNEALRLIGGIDDLDSAKRSVAVKLGVFNPKGGHHASVSVVDAVINSFDLSPKIYLAESDNYRGTGTERLQIWKELFSKRVVPFNLSEDKDAKPTKVADETIGLSQILFKPNVFVSAHILRIFEQGSVLKNLLGLIPDAKKVRFHKKLAPALADMYEAVGGIDLAVLDGTNLSLGVAPTSKRIDANILVVGRDAVAVETVGSALAGTDPKKVPVLQEAVKRHLGEGNLDKIRILGSPFEDIREKLAEKIKASKKKRKASTKKRESKA